MGFINLAEKTINAKLVYYGCGMGGKTTSLQVVHEIMCPRNEVQLVSIKTEEDATLLFDFLPIDIGQVEGFKVRIQGFTVPGQPKYRRMRKYVLSGADAVVFVVDSETSRLEENIQSFESLRENLASNGLDESSMPIVLQYNKRDLEDLLPESELDERFCFREGLRSYPSVATERRGVWEAFVEAAGQLVDAKVRLYGLGRGKIAPEAVAESARNKLWEIFDASDVARSLREKDAERPSLQLTFDEDGRSVVDATSKPRRQDRVELLPTTDPEVEAIEPEGAESEVRGGPTAELVESESVDEDTIDVDAANGDSVDQDARTGESSDSALEPVQSLEKPDGEESEEQAGAPDEAAQLGIDPEEITPQSVALFSDEDFELELAGEVTAAHPEVVGPAMSIDDEEPLPELLDATVATNLQLVERFGDLERYAAQLEQKNRELVESTQNIVHDLNRPLSAIRLMLSTMRKGYAGELSDMAGQCVDTGIAATDQMDHLIRDLLDSSRLDFDGVHLDFQTCDLAILVTKILGGMRYELEEHDVRVRVEPLPTVSCDEWMITRVFGNLLGNAIQYRNTERQPRITISSEELSDCFVLSISDNGIGIPEKDVDTLFQRFVRGSNTGGISGTGLGLHITREIMLGHGGDAWVESREGAGTTFHLSFPFEPVQPPHSAVSDIEPGAKVVVEEDFTPVASSDDSA